MLPHSGMCLSSSNNRVCLVYAKLQDDYSTADHQDLSLNACPQIILGAQESPVENHEVDAEPFYHYHVRCDLEGAGKVNRDTFSRDKDTGQDRRPIIGMEG